MVTNPFVRPVGITAAAIGIVQGLTWTILSLLAILIHERKWEPEFDTNMTHGESLSFILVQYLVDNTKLLLVGNENIHLNSTDLFAVSLAYLTLSLLWIAMSSLLLWALIQKQYVLKNYYNGWAMTTGMICVCDLVLASLLASDYDYQVTATNKTGASFSLSALACGVLMTIAARGFVLWIINLTFVVLIFKLYKDITDKEPNNGLNNHASGTFGSASSPHHGINNPAYNWDDDKPNFTRSNSFLSPSPQSYNPPPQNYLAPPPKPNHNDRLAKIGKPGAKSTPYNVAPPKPPQNYIYPTQPRAPSPDYSPPQTPLKSALKNRPVQNPFTFPNNTRY